MFKSPSRTGHPLSSSPQKVSVEFIICWEALNPYFLFQIATRGNPDPTSGVTLTPTALVEQAPNGGFVKSISFPDVGYSITSSIDSQLNQFWRFTTTVPEVDVSIAFLLLSLAK